MTFEGMNEMRDMVHHNAEEHGFWEPVPVTVTDTLGIRHQMRADRSFGDLIALVHTEASEAYTEWRHGHELKEVYYTYKAQPGKAASARLFNGKTWCYVGDEPLFVEGNPADGANWVELAPETAARLGYDCEPEGVPIELADIILRVLDIAGGEGIDIQWALSIKAAYNAHRPHLHGGKRS